MEVSPFLDDDTPPIKEDNKIYYLGWGLVIIFCMIIIYVFIYSGTTEYFTTDDTAIEDAIQELNAIQKNNLQQNF